MKKLNERTYEEDLAINIAEELNDIIQYQVKGVDFKLVSPSDVHVPKTKLADRRGRFFGPSKAGVYVSIEGTMRDGKVEDLGKEFIVDFLEKVKRTGILEPMLEYGYFKLYMSVEDGKYGANGIINTDYEIGEINWICHQLGDSWTWESRFVCESIEDGIRKLNKAVAQFNELRAEGVKKMGDEDSIYLETGSTLEAPPHYISELSVDVTETEVSLMWVEEVMEGWHYKRVAQQQDAPIDEDGDVSVDGLLDTIAYMRRCVKKAIKFWEKANPDNEDEVRGEIEQDDDDEYEVTDDPVNEAMKKFRITYVKHGIKDYLMSDEVEAPSEKMALKKFFNKKNHRGENFSKMMDYDREVNGITYSDFKATEI